MQFHVRDVYAGNSALSLGISFENTPSLGEIHLIQSAAAPVVQTVQLQFEYIALVLYVEAKMRWPSITESDLTFHLHTPGREKGAVKLAPRVELFTIEPCSYRAGLSVRRLPVSTNQPQ